MSVDAVRSEMDSAWAKAREELLGLMNAAPPDNIISGTEWQARAIQQELARTCFQIMVQNKVDELDQSPQGAFPPGKGSAATGLSPRGNSQTLGDHGQR